MLFALNQTFSSATGKRVAAMILLTSLSMTSLVKAADEVDEEAEKEWKEVALQLPEAPKAGNLIDFYQSNNLSFAIDTRSVNVASDGTVRYTLIATSASGAKNISYEGIRCQSYEKKLYAFGRPDGNWSRSRKNQWEVISGTNTNKQHFILFTDYFCEGNSVAGKTDTIVDRLRGKRSLFSR